MIGYKGFKKDLTCRGFQYEVGKTYTFDGEIELCESGFHFCKTLSGVLKYYNLGENHRFCEVEVLGKVIKGYNKCVTNKIKIVKEIQINDVLKEFSKDKDNMIRYEVANNINTDSKTLSNLSQDEMWYVRHAVASHPNTTVEDLKNLSKDESADVRKAVAKNHNTSVEDLSKLAQDEIYYIREYVAKNHNTSVEDLSKLAQDENIHVRYAVAKNPNYIN